MLESSIERKYKESISDSFLKRITEYTDVSKAPGLLKVIWVCQLTKFVR